jgi:sugar phosphate isomerase/epimerase
MSKQFTFSVFTKSWKLPLPELGKFIHGLGFDAIELPVRPGYQVEPGNVEKGLPEAAKKLAEHGVKIASVAGPVDEPTFAGCAAAGVPVIRVMVGIGPEGYMATEAATQKQYDSLLPLAKKYGVTIGVQNHCDRFVCNAMGLRHLTEKYDPKQVGIVWDPAHNALNGEDPDIALDMVSSHLRMVNLKNAYWKRTTGPEAPCAKWQHYWTTGPDGLANWLRVAAELKARNYAGPICLTAEYADAEATDRLIAEDLAFARSLFA